MKLRILAVGKRQPRWVEQGVAEYAKRLPRHFSFEIVEIAAAPRSGNTNVAQLMAREAEGITSRIPKDHWVVALDERGQKVSTEDMAKALDRWQSEGTNVDLVIGGADGLAPTLLNNANARWSLSGLTLPHGLVRVMLTEAVYRAWSVTQNHPYHRE